MVKEEEIPQPLPEFLTCKICKEVKLSTEVIYDAALDGEEVKICGSCYRKHGADS